jgi:hypothetical protein
MRRSYISPEYDIAPAYGTFNMLEESTFFSAKMLEIEDSITIDNLDIIYYQKGNGEQLDLSIESSLPSYAYSSANDKNGNHTLIMDESQPKYQLDNNTRWLLKIELNTILVNYLFSTLKKYRTFEGIKNDMTIYNNIDTAVYSYINLNILNRYKLKGVELYVKYNDLRSQSALRYKNIWDKSIESPDNTLTKIQTQTEINESSIIVSFNQEKPSSTYNYNYYFNILFEKI